MNKIVTYCGKYGEHIESNFFVLFNWENGKSPASIACKGK